MNQFETICRLREQLLECKLQMVESKFAMEYVRKQLRAVDSLLAYEHAIDTLMSRMRAQDAAYTEQVLKELGLPRSWDSTKEATGKTLEPVSLNVVKKESTK